MCQYCRGKIGDVKDIIVEKSIPRFGKISSCRTIGTRVWRVCNNNWKDPWMINNDFEDGIKSTRG